MKIYTRTGDRGETGLFGGTRISKADLRVEAYGSVDELNAEIGLAIVERDGDDPFRLFLLEIQRNLLVLGADLACAEPDTSKVAQRSVRMGEEAVARLEAEIDRLDEKLPPLRKFILPGGAPLGARLHVARTACRRAERRCVELSRQQSVNPIAITYLNRLSDLLFVMARAANQSAGVPDVEW